MSEWRAHLDMASSSKSSVSIRLMWMPGSSNAAASDGGIDEKRASEPGIASFGDLRRSVCCCCLWW